jgi:hypothetical protein
MEKFVEFRKQDSRRQVVLGVVYAPNAVDSQGDYASAETIEKAAYRFLASGRVQALDINHDGKACGARVVESFISKGDDELPAGSWVMGAWCPPEVWGDVLEGRLTGFSLTGRGERVEKALNGKPAREIQNLEVYGVSLVRKPANQTAFALLKGDDAPAWARALVESINALASKVAENGRGLEATKATLAKGSKRAHGFVNVPRAVDQSAEIAKGVERRLEVLNAKLHELWEGGYSGRNAGAREATILAEIEKAETELAALHGSADQFGVGDPSRSAFHQRGGQSFRVRTDRVPVDSAYAPKKDAALRKSREDAVDLTSLKI